MPRENAQFKIIEFINASINWENIIIKNNVPKALRKISAGKI